MTDHGQLPQDDWHRIFEQQYDIFYRRLVYMAGYIVKDKQEAHDIVIDVLLKIRARLMSGKVSLDELKPAYFKTAVNNACLDRLKAQKRLAMLNGRTPPMPDPAPDLADGEEETHRALLLQAIELIEELPRQQKEVMTLIYFEGQPVQAVAGKMGIAPSTVYQHRQAALRALKEKQAKRKGIDPEILLLLVLLCRYNHYWLN
ncbi:RNA polymerase sigma factor [Puia dinghuensis]|nr:sigma-70 family RNA polymerase sigma factor [Puia dinghuensis]